MGRDSGQAADTFKLLKMCIESHAGGSNDVSLQSEQGTEKVKICYGL
jgi:hypothetical protein